MSWHKMKSNASGFDIYSKKATLAGYVTGMEILSWPCSIVEAYASTLNSKKMSCNLSKIFQSLVAWHLGSITIKCFGSPSSASNRLAIGHSLFHHWDYEAERSELSHSAAGQVHRTVRQSKYRERLCLLPQIHLQFQRDSTSDCQHFGISSTTTKQFFDRLYGTALSS
jgi:hypothetical protein